MADALCIDEGCPHHGTPHVCVMMEIKVTRADKLEIFTNFCKKFKRKKLLQYLFDTLERHVAKEKLMREVYDAMVKDFGDPDDFQGDDGPVGMPPTVITFALMRKIKAALPNT